MALADEPKEPAVTSAPLVTETAVPIPKGKKEWKYDAEPVVMENADWVERETVELDRYHCDLNMFVRFTVNTTPNCMPCHQLIVFFIGS